MLERNGHGGDWATAAETFGVAPADMLDYSANINPLGPPESLAALMAEEWKHAVRYPDPECRELRAAFAAAYGVAAECIMAANGAAEALDLAFRALQPRTVAVIDPGFGEYREFAEKSGAHVISVAADATNGFRVPLAVLQDMLTKADAIVLGQPNNPTGVRWTKGELLRLAEQAEQLGKTIVVDEAFIDFFPDERETTLIRAAASSPAIVVIRSLTKFYAIPGLRLGFAAAVPSLIREMRRLQVPWSVNHFAQRAGAAVLGDEEYAERTRGLIVSERAWLSGALAGLGWRVFEGAANFVLARIPDGQPEAQALQQMLGAKGILIRRCKTFLGLDDKYVRLAVRSRADNVRLIAALEEALLGRPSGSGKR